VTSTIWTPDLAVGDAALDEQHKELFARAAALGDALARGEGRARVGELVAFLAGYTRYHFHEEELVMTAAGYPAFDGHRKLHLEFVREVTRAQEQLRLGKASPTLAIDFYRRVGQWLTAHIGGHDKAFAEWRRKGAPPR
jgi:hemerythrin